MLSHVAIDGRLITGQNPTSTVDVATALVKSL
jgi:putative intracellular protease/amidase